MAAFLCFSVLVFCVGTILAHPKADLDFTKCISDNQALFVRGIENLVESSDPLQVDVINAILPDLKYKLRNAKLTGLKDCTVSKLRINTTRLSFEYDLECKQLEANAQYYLRGLLRDIFVEGDGDVNVKTGFYILKFYGNFEKILDEDNIEHAHIKNYYLDFEARDNLVFNFTNLYGGDKEKSDALHKFINENWGLLDKTFRSAVLSGFMDTFIDHLNEFLKVTPIKKVFLYECD